MIYGIYRMICETAPRREVSAAGNSFDYNRNYLTKVSI